MQFREMKVKATLVRIDEKIGGVDHDITKLPVAYSLVTAAKRRECLGTVYSITCRTWSVATFGADAEGKPGKPYRDFYNSEGIRRTDGTMPYAVLQ